MRWVIILLIALGISAFAVYKNQERPAIRDLPVTTSPETPVLYQDDIFGFKITYQQKDEMKPDGFEGFLPTTLTPIVAFELPKQLFDKTNLLEAGVFIGASSSPNAKIACAKPSKDTSETSLGTTTINGVSWNVFSSTGAAAGNLYETKSYRTVHGEVCFEIVELLHSGNIGNYPEGVVVEFDKAKFSSMLEAIAETFTFTK